MDDVVYLSVFGWVSDWMLGTIVFVDLLFCELILDNLEFGIVGLGVFLYSL